MVVIIIKQKGVTAVCVHRKERTPFSHVRSRTGGMMSTVMREMLDDIFTVFLMKEAWRVWVGLIVLWLVVCLFAKVR